MPHGISGIINIRRGKKEHFFPCCFNSLEPSLDILWATFHINIGFLLEWWKEPTFLHWQQREIRIIPPGKVKLTFYMKPIRFPLTIWLQIVVFIIIIIIQRYHFLINILTFKVSLGICTFCSRVQQFPDIIIYFLPFFPRCPQFSCLSRIFNTLADTYLCSILSSILWNH